MKEKVERSRCMGFEQVFGKGSILLVVWEMVNGRIHRETMTWQRSGEDEE